MAILRSLTAGLGLSGAVYGTVSPLTTSTSPLTSVTLSELYPDLSPEELDELRPLDRASAMRVPALSKARDVIVTGIAGLPVFGMRGATTLKPSECPLLAQVDPGRPNVLTYAWTVDSLFHYGRAYWLVLERHQDRRPRYARWVGDHQIEHDPETGEPVAVDGSPVRPDDLIRFDGLHEGICNRSGVTVRRVIRTERAAANASDNPVPSIELHQTGGDPMGKTEIDELIARWAQARRGRNGGVAYTNASIEAKTHGQAAEQLLIDGRNASAVDCARIAGVPAWAVDATVRGSSMTYTNVPARSRELLDYTYRGYLDAIAGRLSLDDILPHGQWARHDVSRLLRGDFKERMEAAKIAKEAGLYTDDELREMDTDTPMEA